MSTFYQIVRNCRKLGYIKKKLLYKKPQQKGICVRNFIRSPKKPNSAKRKVASIVFIRRKGPLSNKNHTERKYQVQCYIPGISAKIQQNAIVLFKGGRVKDLPGVRFHLICGVFDFKGINNRKSSRSKYGTKRLTHI